MGLAVFAAIVVVSLLAGVAVQVRGAKKSRFDVLIVGVTLVFGAVFASETFPGSTVFSTIKSWGPSIDGFAFIPGVAFAIVIAVVAYAGTRDTYSTPIAA
jgi:hypothetical protein